MYIYFYACILCLINRYFICRNSRFATWDTHLWTTSNDALRYHDELFHPLEMMKLFQEMLTILKQEKRNGYYLTSEEILSLSDSKMQKSIEWMNKNLSMIRINVC